MGTADRLLLVKVELVRPGGGAVDHCSVRFLDSNGVVLQEDNLTKSGSAGFLNPPQRGQFFVVMNCPGANTVIRKGPFSFEKDHVVELGKILVQ